MLDVSVAGDDEAAPMAERDVIAEPDAGPPLNTHCATLDGPATVRIPTHTG